MKTSVVRFNYPKTSRRFARDSNRLTTEGTEITRTRKSTLSRPPSKEECISDQFNYAILRGCLCYLFQSTGLSNGTFLSPELDFLRIKQLTCLLFTFVGDVNEIVRLEFTHFLLDPKDPPQENSSNCHSYIRIFDSLERAELNQNDQEAFRLCGSERNLPQRVFYSTGRVLIFEIHLVWQYSNPIDLRGRFQFESKEWYLSGGAPIPQSTCDRLFLSPDTYSASFFHTDKNYPKVNTHSRSGRFFSPGFPRNYPVNSTCTYYFIGTTEERISISLTDVNLRGPEQCGTTHSHDQIEIRDLDASIKLTQTGPIDQHTKMRIRSIKPVAIVCGRVTETTIVSDGPSLTLHFISTNANWLRGGGGGFGFRGRYEFIGAHDFRIVTGHNRLITRQFEAKDQVADQSIQTSGESKGFVVKHIKPDAHRLSGVIESPNYPRPYPENLQMHYVFHVPPEMRVRIKFFDFCLDNHDANSCPLSNSDRLEVYDGAYPETTRQLVLCGAEVPTILFHKQSSAGELISSKDIFTLRFLTDAIRFGNERGFVLSYAFTPGTHLSSPERYALKPQQSHSTVHTGSDEWPESLMEGDCQYLIRSHGKDDTGHIWIARYVHTLPGNISQLQGGKVPNCRWRLRGKPGQRIQLKLIKQTGTPRSYESTARISPIQHDEQSGLDRIRSSLEQSGRTRSYLTNLKCHTPISVELVNYRPITAQGEQEFKEMDHLLDEKHFGLRTASLILPDDAQLSSTAQEEQANTNAPNFIHSNVIPRVEPSDPVRLCADESVSQSPAAKGFMSGNVPQLDVILRLDTPVFNEQSKGPVMKQLADYLILGYDIQYKFVTGE
ncbi:unnamed protein product [Echinostoma caproni]|uniref:CUB domain-containing protein n=1 Tax=Echinostoma caproni TaxID=27848 RepID=A0A183A576_9TREM|nr:unnamed protein product [Echinostoma caproni]